VGGGARAKDERRPSTEGQRSVAKQTNEEENDRRWRRLSVIGTFIDAAARLAEILLRR